MLLLLTVGVMRLSRIKSSALVVVVVVVLAVVLCLEGGDPVPVVDGMVCGLSVEDVRPILLACLLVVLLLRLPLFDLSLLLLLLPLELSIAEELSCAVVAVLSLTSFMFIVSLSAVTLLLSFETGERTAGASGCAAGTRETESERPSGSS